MNWQLWGVRTHPLTKDEITRTGDDFAVGTRHGPLVSDRSGAGGSENVAQTSSGHRRWLYLALLVVLALTAVACGGPQKVPVAQTSDTPRAVAATDLAGQQQPDQNTSDSHDGDPAASARTDAGSDASGNTDPTASDNGRVQTDGPGQEGTRKRSADVAKPGGANDQLNPDMDAMDVTATVEPECVRRGGTVTITVTTRGTAGVAYHAIYSDGEGGAVPPYGKGYGGNGGAMADANGRYTDRWVVSPKAPSGAGHVDVVVGWAGEFGQTKVPFSVADPVTGNCGP